MEKKSSETGERYFFGNIACECQAEMLRNVENVQSDEIAAIEFAAILQFVMKIVSTLAPLTVGKLTQEQNSPCRMGSKCPE